MPASVEIQAGMAEAFNVLSSEFQNGVTVTLLKESATADVFDTIRTVTSNRFFEYSNLRKNFTLEIAEDSAQLTTDMGLATHVGINSDVYTIIQGDTLPPAGTLPVWQIHCNLFERPGHYTAL